NGGAQAFAAPLTAPPDDVFCYDYFEATVGATRYYVGRHSRQHGVAEARVDGLVQAASEIAANSIRHGGGFGRLAIWADAGALIVQLTDAGHIVDPLAGRLAPPPEALDGRGLHLANQLCDLVQLRSSPEGTVVRLVTWL